MPLEFWFFFPSDEQRDGEYEEGELPFARRHVSLEIRLLDLRRRRRMTRGIRSHLLLGGSTRMTKPNGEC